MDWRRPLRLCSLFARQTLSRVSAAGALLAVIAAAATAVQGPQGRGGVLLVPGVAGTGLFMTASRASFPSCDSRSGVSMRGQRIWAPLFHMFPPFARQKCFVEKLSLDYSCPAGSMPADFSTVWEEAGKNAFPLAPGVPAPPLFERGADWLTDLGARESRFWALPRWLVRVWRWILSWFRRGSALDRHGRAGVPECVTGAGRRVEAEYANMRGTTVYVQDPGGVAGFEYLDYIDGFGVYGTGYFHTVISTLRSAGYSGDRLMGFPYDWRRPFWQVDTSAMRYSLEQFVQNHPGERVVVIAHSLGAVIANRFLSEMPPAWKRAHVAAFVPIAGAFGGSFKAIRCLLSGYTELSTLDLFGSVNVTIIPPLLMRSAYRSFGSLYALAPHPAVFSETDDFIEVAIGEDGYNAVRASQPRLLPSYSKKYNLTSWWELLPEGNTESNPAASGVTARSFRKKAQQAYRNLLLHRASVLEDPGVPVYCFWADLGFPGTEVGLIYRTPNIDDSPVYRLSYGDGTLPRQSAAVCAKWKSTEVARQFDGHEHMGVLMSPELNDAVLAVLARTFAPRGSDTEFFAHPKPRYILT